MHRPVPENLDAGMHARSDNSGASLTPLPTAIDAARAELMTGAYGIAVWALEYPCPCSSLASLFVPGLAGSPPERRDLISRGVKIAHIIKLAYEGSRRASNRNRHHTSSKADTASLAICAIYFRSHHNHLGC
jgi:hypothetical protein